jgi:arginyl-tRNA--protein-N-Asp/Glu arginylyltransferase
MRRRPGIAGLQNAAATRDQFRLVGENVAKVRTDVMKEQLATFRTQLEEFALKHKVNSNRKLVIRRNNTLPTRNVKHLAFRDPAKLSSTRTTISDDELEACYDNTCIFAFKFFRWQRSHRHDSLRDFVLEFRERRSNNNLASKAFWQNFQPSERQRRIWKRRYSIVPYTVMPSPLNIVYPNSFLSSL